MAPLVEEDAVPDLFYLVLFKSSETKTIIKMHLTYMRLNAPFHQIKVISTVFTVKMSSSPIFPPCSIITNK